MTDNTGIRPFQANFPDAELTELCRRVNTTRWPERETVADQSQGPELATMQKLARYWATDVSFFGVKGVSIPVAVSIFPDEIYQAPKSWTESAYPKLIYYNKVAKGGHFQPGNS